MNADFGAELYCFPEDVAVRLAINTPAIDLLVIFRAFARSPSATPAPLARPA